jgi:uncharacterized repeat protein (TIGR02543 family)
MKSTVLTTSEAAANRSGAMETGDHFNGAGSKSQRSRRNFLRKACFALLVTCIIFGGCEENDEYTVAFNSNGGSDVASQTVKSGQKAVEPKDPTRDGYTFDAWYKEEELSNEWQFDLDVVTVSMTLYAKWIADGGDDENGKDAEEVYLVTEIAETGDSYEDIRYLEYDEQNRITKIITSVWEKGYTWTETEIFKYNSAGDLVSYTDEDGDIITFTKIGNKITVKTDDSNVVETIELNAQGLLEKKTTEEALGDDWAKVIATYQYQGRNIIKIMAEMEAMIMGEYYSEEAAITFTYDDWKSPFYHCNTPQWFLLFHYEFFYGVHNNVKTKDLGNGEDAAFEYTYNDAGFPVSRDVTERWYDDDELYTDEYTETFKYETPQAAGVKSALQEAPVGSDIGAASPKKNLRRHPGQSFGHGFGNRSF